MINPISRRGALMTAAAAFLAPFATKALAVAQRFKGAQASGAAPADACEATASIAEYPTVTYTYDELARVVSVSEPDEGRSESFVYHEQLGA